MNILPEYRLKQTNMQNLIEQNLVHTLWPKLQIFHIPLELRSRFACWFNSIHFF